MGLDQFAYARDKEGNVEELAYWRKHNALDGWMQNLYAEVSTCTDEYDPFNGQELPLDREDIQLLFECVNRNLLPETHGFFFGNDSRNDPDQKEITVQFINDALKALDEGKEVFYQKSW